MQTVNRELYAQLSEMLQRLEVQIEKQRGRREQAKEQKKFHRRKLSPVSETIDKHVQGAMDQQKEVKKQVLALKKQLNETYKNDQVIALENKLAEEQITLR